jgi:NAD(P)-dependent dehydrogenase (short-subunit alcohol dehydrogenase family)
LTVVLDVTLSLSVLQTAKDVVSQVVQQLGHVDILVNNASEQHMAASLADVTPEELRRTFETNIFSYFYFAQVQHARSLGVLASSTQCAEIPTNSAAAA